MPNEHPALRVAITVVAACVLSAGCGEDDGVRPGFLDAGSDAGTDAGRQDYDAGGAPEFDAGSDAGGDAGADAGTDAAPHCAWGISDAGVCNDAVEIAAGGEHTCARRALGDVVCWGLASSGQLGDGAMVHVCGGSPAYCSLTPVAVSGLADAVEISAGGSHTCARRASGGVECWGSGGSGQLGDGSMTHSRCDAGDCALTPVSVAGLTDAIAVSAGGGHACAVRASGAVVCWGFNGSGELGDGTTTDSSTPVVVAGVADAVEISAGGAHTCAIRASGSVVCWGVNWAGQLGDDTMIERHTPTPVSGLADAVAVACGTVHTCALRASGAVVCWGSNVYGQLGDGMSHSSCTPSYDARYDCSLTPVTISGLTDVIAISAGWEYTCATRASGAVVCWGSNADGQLGAGASGHTACPYWRTPGSFDCSRTPVSVSGLTDGVEVSSGGRHACARRASGDLVCWGFNLAGQLGDGTTTGRSTPVTVIGPP